MEKQSPTSPELFNVRPCLDDPVFGTLEDRWGWPPIAGAGLFLTASRLALGVSLLGLTLYAGFAFFRARRHPAIAPG